MTTVDDFNAGDKVNNTIAAGAITSPLWIEYLVTASAFFGHLLPVLGVTWLCLQMYTHWHKYYKSRKDKK